MKERKDRIGMSSKNGLIFMKISYFDPSFPIWTKFRNAMAQRIRNVSAIQENPNMALCRLELVEKYFQKIEFLKMSKLENCTHLIIFLIELEICSVCDILLRERRM